MHSTNKNLSKLDIYIFVIWNQRKKQQNQQKYDVLEITPTLNNNNSNNNQNKNIQKFLLKNENEEMNRTAQHRTERHNTALYGVVCYSTVENRKKNGK